MTLPPGPPAPVCRSCGEKNQRGARECWVCGEPLTAASDAPVPARARHGVRSTWDLDTRTPGSVAVWVVVGLLVIGTIPVAPGFSILLVAIALPVALVVPHQQAPPTWVVTLLLLIVGLVAGVIAGILACSVVAGMGSARNIEMVGLVVGGFVLFGTLIAAARAAVAERNRRRRQRGRWLAEKHTEVFD